MNLALVELGTLSPLGQGPVLEAYIHSHNPNPQRQTTQQPQAFLKQSWSCAHLPQPILSIHSPATGEAGATLHQVKEISCQVKSPGGLHLQQKPGRGQRNEQITVAFMCAKYSC